MASKQNWQKIMVIVIAACAAVLILSLMICSPESPIETTPIVNPLTAELDKANMLIDSLASFNNLLIRELEECEDE